MVWDAAVLPVEVGSVDEPIDYCPVVAAIGPRMTDEDHPCLELRHF